MTDPGDAFRRFALDVYHADGVSPAALLLQDRCGVDVNVVLLAAFVGAVEGLTLSPRDIDEIQHRVGAWQHDVVQPLRALRTRLKSGPPPAPTTVTTALRNRIKELELDAETVELDELAAFAVGFDGLAASGTAAERATAAMTVVVSNGVEREPTATERGAIAVIARAADAVGRTG